MINEQTGRQTDKLTDKRTDRQTENGISILQDEFSNFCLPNLHISECTGEYLILAEPPPVVFHFFLFLPNISTTQKKTKQKNWIERNDSGSKMQIRLNRLEV